MCAYLQVHGEVNEPAVQQGYPLRAREVASRGIPPVPMSKHARSSITAITAQTKFNTAKEGDQNQTENLQDGGT